jgi:hypothetical protein
MILHQTNSNSKLLCDTFADFRPWSDVPWIKGTRYDIYESDQLIGIAEVVEAKCFTLKYLNAHMTQVVYGAGVPYALKVLSRMHGQLNDEDKFGMIFFKWIYRDQAQVERLIKSRLQKLFSPLKKAS